MIVLASTDQGEKDLFIIPFCYPNKLESEVLQKTIIKIAFLFCSLCIFQPVDNSVRYLGSFFNFTWIHCSTSLPKIKLNLQGL